ncbi:MaoC family dehydratase [Dactylosporangium sp. CA-233914]|uniref:MaoC family dehydratase n=1 Tax=Dactylosporangium sp. CA-233914 TaxID=3239934 RepID=UPI003D8B8DCA
MNGIDDLERSVGTHLGYSEWHQVTQEQVNAFADATGDRQWIHVDPARAAVGPFGAAIAHGYLTLSLVPMFLSQIYRVDGPSMMVNYGTDKVRFPSIVPVGSRLRGGAELLAVTPISSGHQFAIRVTVERQSGGKPACVADVLTVAVS